MICRFCFLCSPRRLFFKELLLTAKLLKEILEQLLAVLLQNPGLQPDLMIELLHLKQIDNTSGRSEERRVGKECLA